MSQHRNRGPRRDATNTPVVVEYDGVVPGSRLQRPFRNAYRARAFYARKLARGKNPKVRPAPRQE